MTALQSLLSALLDAAARAGADAADAMAVAATSLSVTRRLGAIETVERAEHQDVGLRVFVGCSQAVVSAQSLAPADFAAFAERAVAMARVVPEDPEGGLTENPAPAEDPAILDLDDGSEPAAGPLTRLAACAEDAARAIAGITNSDGAEASAGRSRTALATSTGFFAETARTSHGISITAMAGSGTSMQRDYAYHSATHAADLHDPVRLGQEAAHRAIARLDPVRPRTATLPVVFDPRVAASLVSHLAAAANGASIARGTSFLRGRLGERLFPPGITLLDDPRRPRGLRSRTYDAEAVATARRTLVADGVLASYLLDQRSARKLGLASTGHAVRGVGSAPGPAPSNLYLAAGTLSREALIGEIGLGILVTELSGTGVNLMTGDYSRGAAGFMIRDGALAEPVAEFTIAGSLPAMFAGLTAASDLDLAHGVDAPTLRLDALRIAGQA